MQALAKQIPSNRHFKALPAQFKIKHPRSYHYHTIEGCQSLAKFQSSSKPKIFFHLFFLARSQNPIPLSPSPPGLVYSHPAFREPVLFGPQMGFSRAHDVFSSSKPIVKICLFFVLVCPCAYISIIFNYFDPLKLPLTTTLGGVCSYIFPHVKCRIGGGSSRKQGEMYERNSPGT